MRPSSGDRTWNREIARRRSRHASRAVEAPSMHELHIAHLEIDASAAARETARIETGKPE
eukprot:1454358-Pleurochrysis_carterae.AAC.1